MIGSSMIGWGDEVVGVGVSSEKARTSRIVRVIELGVSSEKARASRIVRVIEVGVENTELEE